MIKIKLNNNVEVLISDEDWVMTNYTWFITGREENHYVSTKISNKQYTLHHMIYKAMGVIIPANMEIDHIDRNSLNNQRDNLRIVTKSKNIHNTGVRKNNTTGGKDITYDKQLCKYRARISINGHRISLGRFDTLDEALEARKKAELRWLSEVSSCSLISMSQRNIMSRDFMLVKNLMG